MITLAEIKQVLQAALPDVVVADKLVDINQRDIQKLHIRVGYSSYDLTEPEIDLDGMGTLSIAVSLRGNARHYDPDGMNVTAVQVVNTLAVELGFVLDQMSWSEDADFYEQTLAVSRPEPI